MFGLGFGEIVIILVLALILFGPKKLPEVAKQLGKGMRDFQKATEDLKGQFEKEFYADEAKKARPQIVPPPAAAPLAASPPMPVPAASTENVPGLDAALVEAPAAAPVPGAPAAATPPAQEPRGSA
jgi:TatA/E family protein of Tat protein translocase